MEATELLAVYSEKGFVVHPLSKPDSKGNSPGKRPVLNEWQKLTDTPADINKYVEKGYNLGLVCGKASDVIVFDFDHFLFLDEIFRGFDTETLRCKRTEGRGHVYFKYTSDLPASKHHDLGLEVLSDGNNAVIPPSIHSSGDDYKWSDINSAISDLPAAVIVNLKRLFAIEAELKQYLSKVRTCFRDVLKRRPDMHGSDGREYMLAVCTDLKANGAKEEHIRMFARMMYGADYNEERTITEWNNIDGSKTWQCSTLRSKLSSYVDTKRCTRCADRPVSDSAGTPVLPREMELDDIVNLNKKELERKLSIDLPADHFVSRCVEWLDSINDGYHEYKVMSAFWILSALAHNKAVLKLKQGDIRPNLWICMLGKSTVSRKSTVVNAARNVFEVATDSLLYNEDYSIEGYLETLSENSVMHNVRDEVAGLMAKFHKKYNEGIFELECAIYECQNVQKTLGSGKNKKPRVFTVYNPYVTKLYATTPDNFSRYMTVEDFTCGYGYRFLFMYPNYSRPRMALEMQSEEDIEAWSGVLATIKKMNRYFSMFGMEVPFKIDTNAMKYYNDVIKSLEDRAESSSNDFVGAAIGRNQGHILKLAMLIELGKHEPSMNIGIDSMAAACKMVVDYFLPEMLDMIERLQDDIKMYQVEKVSTTLIKKGGVMTHSQLLHDTKLKSYEFGECIATLIESRTIEPIREKNTKIVYYRILNNNHSKNVSTLPILQILPVLSLSKGNIHQENLENSNKLTELTPRKHFRARVLGCEQALGCNSIGESENWENSEGIEEAQKVESTPSDITEKSLPKTAPTPDGHLVDKTFSRKSHDHLSTPSDITVMTPIKIAPKSETGHTSNITCKFCSQSITSSSNIVNFGAGIGNVHEACYRLYEKAFINIRKKYNNYTPDNPADLSRRLDGMLGLLYESLEEFSDAGIQLILDRYCKERSWPIA